MRGPRPPSGPVAKLLNSAELCVLRAQGVGRKAGQARMLQPARLAALNPTRRNRPSRRLAYCRRHRRPWERGAASNGALVTRGSFPGQQCWRTGGRWQHEGNCVSGTAFAHIPWLRVCTTPGPGRTLFLYAHFTEEGFEVWEVKRLSRDPETPSTTLYSLTAATRVQNVPRAPALPASARHPQVGAGASHVTDWPGRSEVTRKQLQLLLSRPPSSWEPPRDGSAKVSKRWREGHLVLTLGSETVCPVRAGEPCEVARRGPDLVGQSLSNAQLLKAYRSPPAS